LILEKKMKYRIIQASGSIFEYAAEKLEDEVCEAIENGWQPCGGISVTLTPDGYLLAQAMVKN
jgi:hypothetical protein